jgi:superfamily II RNA helicase
VKKRKSSLAALEGRVAQLESSLTAEQRQDLAQLDDIVTRRANSQNSKKKAAQREFDRWQEDHRGTVWTLAKQRYDEWVVVQKEHASQKEVLDSVLKRGASVPEVLLRARLLEEFGYANSDGTLTVEGRLASEINEGHPFLMTSFFLRQSKQPFAQHNLLTTLALFLGEGGEREDVLNKQPADLAVDSCVKGEILALDAEAGQWCDREQAVGLVYDAKFWSLSTEWIEPVSKWLEGELTLAGLAREFGLFEGNCLKALMKLAGLVEEMKALASLTGSVDLLKELEDSGPLILRDVVVAESLYLRL